MATVGGRSGRDDPAGEALAAADDTAAAAEQAAVERADRRTEATARCDAVPLPPAPDRPAVKDEAEGLREGPPGDTG